MFSLTELVVIGYLCALAGLVVGLLLGKASAQQEQEDRAARIAAAVEKFDRDAENPEAMPRRHLERYPEPRSGVHGRWL